MRALLVIAIITLGLIGSAMAQDDAGCGKFAWPLTVERQQLAGANKPALDAGAQLEAKTPGAFTMRLRPADQVTFAHSPERKREGFAGYVTIGPLGDGAGLYQVTLSHDAWLDVIQNGEFARSAGSSGRRDCPGLRKSVRFHLQGAPTVIQVSGVETDQIAVVIRKVE
jgi:hypothetical protein